MRKKALFSITCLSVMLLFFIKNNNINSIVSKIERTTYEKLINEHEFSKIKYTIEELNKIPKKDRPDLAWQQDYLATMNPVLGRPEREKLFPILNMTKQLQQNSARIPGTMTAPWVERGPDNIGGRTRALAWDPTTINKVWAGSVAGGLWYNNNITTNTASWQSVNDFWDNLAITTITFDPINSQIMYVGTGEGWGNLDAVRGAGVFKSTDGGVTFNQLVATTGFNYVNDLVIRNESGTSVIYVALNNSTLQRSIDGGTTWTDVFSTVKITDLDIATDNKLWLGGAGKIYSSVNGTSFTLKHTHTGSDRVNLACAPSNANYIYAAFEAGGKLSAFKQSTDNGTSWTSKNEPNDDDPGISANDFTRNQAWYDLTLDVDSLDENSVMIGGIDVFKTSNGGASWQQMTHWYGGFGHPYLHSDQHAIVYKKGSSTEVLFGNDGGVGYTSDGNVAVPTINTRINDYNVTQFYAAAIHPNASSNIFLAGSQDNGSQRFTSLGINSTTEVTGGDGAFCHIDQTNGNYQTTSYVYNVFYHSSNNGVSFSQINGDQNTGRFINPSDLDNNQNILYTYRNSTSLYRVTNFESASPSVGTVTISSLGSSASHLSVSPHTTASTTLFVGTTSGRVFKITDANSTPVSTEITGGSFPTGSVSCIAFGQNENEILITFSNYGVTSVWYTLDGGTSWTSKEGNLPDMPVRWALFNPTNYNEVILATEVGVWGTVNISAGSPSWSTSSSGLANVRVDMLQYRTSDNEVIAATHGRGLFSSDGFNGATPFVAEFIADDTTPSNIQNVTFTDNTNLSPNSWTWTFSPSTITYQNGTNANSQNPQVIFNDLGLYTVTLVATNALNTDTETKTDYINVSTPSYCDAQSNDSTFEHISNVTFGTINNTSISSNYSNFTAQSTDVDAGSSYTLEISYTQDYSSDELRVWIDFNQDYDFIDAGEEFVFTQGGGASSPYTKSILIPSGAVAGQTRMRVRLHDTDFGPNYSSCGNSSYGEVEDYNINIIIPLCSGTTTTWNGTVWSPATPTINDPIIIDGDYDSALNGSIDACNCIINATKTIKIKANNYLNLNHDLLNNGTIKIFNQGSFVQIDDDATVTGTGVFNTEINTTSLQDANRFTYFSSPTENQTLNIFNSWAKMDRIFSFSGSTQYWQFASAGDAMGFGKGFALQANTSQSFPFIATTNFGGIFNNGLSTQPLYFNVGQQEPDAGGDDSTLVGNPYPSAIDANALLTLNPNANAFYFWTHASPLTTGTYGSDYIVWNSSGGTGGKTQYIASGQGFFVEANTNGNLLFNNSVRIKDNNTDFRNTLTQNDKLWLDLTSNNGLTSQILIAFSENGTQEFDFQYDAKRNAVNSAALSFYSNGLNNEPLAIQTKGIFNKNETIPLGINVLNTNATQLEIKINETELLTNVDIFLMDNYLNILHNLRQSNYNFTVPTIGQYNNRFELRFINSVLNINDNLLIDRLVINKESHNILNIKNLSGRIIKKINIYDLLGKTIYASKINKSNLTILLNNVNQGSILFIKTLLDNGKVINQKYIF